MKLTHGSMFSGVGGMDMGFDLAGYECRWQIEWDKACQSVLRRHWPNIPKHWDVCDVNGADLEPVDVISFGSPCQDLSVAGKRAGLDGTKSSMFFEAIRIIKEMRDATSSRPTGPFPRIAVWENVPGALSSNRGADFGVVIDSLADIGAVDIEWHVLDARWFGIPQRRRRVFVVAVFDPALTADRGSQILPVPTRGGWNPPTRRASWEASTGTLTERFSGGVNGGQWAAGSDGNDTLRTAICSKWSKGTGGPAGDEYYNLVVDEPAGPLTAGMHKGPRGTEAIESNHLIPFVKSKRPQTSNDYETWIESEVAPTINAFDNGEVRATVVVPVAYSIREDAKANTFSATETDTALCLNGLVPSVQSHHAQIFIAETEEPLIIDGTRVADVRIYTDGVTPTLKQRMGTGGGQVPMITEPTPTYAFDSTFGGQSNVFEEMSPPMKVGSALGISSPPAVAQPDTPHYAIRRLCPDECEILMGWPAGHTALTDTDKTQADTNRYKQCGNGVATPVAHWIAKHLKELAWTTSTTTDSPG